MIRRRLKFFTIIVVIIVSLWCAILSFENSIDCAWPSTEELMATSGLPTSSVAIDLEDQGVAQLEMAVAHAIVRRGAFHFPFNPERDFIEHVIPRSPHVWQFKGSKIVPVNDSVLLRAMQSPVDWPAFLSGNYPRLFRFAVVHEEASHACVIVEIKEPVGGMYRFEFWYLFRLGFGLGRWWVVSQGRVLFGW